MSILHPISGTENSDRKADVVFIHGLGGDPFTTWRSGKDNSGSWPHWLGEEFPDVGVWSLGYAASPTKWTRCLGWLSSRWRDAGHSMALTDRAAQLLDSMAQHGLGQRPVLFICHSLGGLLAKQILRKSCDAVDASKKQLARQTRGVLFLATPHTGAQLASLLNGFRAVFGASVSIEELRAHDAHLRDLYDWYRNHAPALGITTVTYYELRGVKSLLPIVNPTSSHPGVGADPVGLDEDHLSIAKPGNPQAQVCRAAANVLRTGVLSAHHVIPPESTLLPVHPDRTPREVIIIDRMAIAGADPHRIPCELPPAAEHFFGRRHELTLLIRRLREARNTAVVGPAGLGKTALAAVAVRDVAGATAETVVAGPFPDGVVFLDLYTFQGQAEPAWNSLANRLAGAGFMERSPGRVRAIEACRGRRVLIIVEGGEEANGRDGRANIPELFSVLSPENRRLLLTRDSAQASVAESVELKEALHPDDAAQLLDSLTQGRVSGALRDCVLELLEGHPLALTWAGDQLARDDDDPGRLVDDWRASRLPRLSDPHQAEHTLEWLFNRGLRGLDATARQTLAAAGLLAGAPFSLALIGAAVTDADSRTDEAIRGALKTLVRCGLLRRSVEGDHWQFTHVLGYRFARQETFYDPLTCERLGRRLHDHLMTALAPGAQGEGRVSPARLLEHAAALLRSDDDQRLWIPLANYLLYDAYDRLVDLGRLPLAAGALGAVESWFERFPETKVNEPDWLRERSALLNRQGNVLSAQGDLAGALASYREGLAVMQRLATADPSNAGWQRDLSLIFTRMAELKEQQGNSTEALEFAEESLAIDERLAALDRTNATWQDDVTVSRAIVARLKSGG